MPEYKLIGHREEFTELEPVKKCKAFASELTYLNPYSRISVYPGSYDCTVDFSDKQTERALLNKGRRVGGWATRGSINFGTKLLLESMKGEKRVDVDADIPINMQEASDLPAINHVLRIHMESLLDKCDIYQIHVHDGEAPSAHLRVKCDNVDDDTVANLSNLVNQCMNTGRAIARGVPIEHVRDLNARAAGREPL